MKHLVGERAKEMVQGVEKMEDLKPDHGGIVKDKNGHVCVPLCVAVYWGSVLLSLNAIECPFTQKFGLASFGCLAR